MADASTPPARPKKQAVLLIHGIGEQRPMATLWKLVELVWLKAPIIPGAPRRRVYSEPDEISGVFELRRLSTNDNADGKRTDFFEFYWAHLMHGNEFGDVLSWLGRLALRPRASMPETLRTPWRILHLSAALIAALVLLAMSSGYFVGVNGEVGKLAIIAAILVGGYALLATANHLFFTPVLGDAARYFRPSPKNVPCRQAIRKSGLELLEALHNSGKYDRIILVGHSLGGVIAYELAHLMWGKRNRLMDRPGRVQEAIVAAELAALELESNPDALAQLRWRKAQEAMFEALRAETDVEGRPLWLISDLVTLGCPLAHAPALLADTPDAFAQVLERREMAACPPQFEIYADGRRRFSYCRRPGAAGDPDAAPRAPHNSAMFAAMRWSNIFFPMRSAFRGDFMAGPAAPVFGAGVSDRAVRQPSFARWVPHMDYFTAQAEMPPPHIAPAEARLYDHRAALREALALEGAHAPLPAALS